MKPNKNAQRIIRIEEQIAELLKEQALLREPGDESELQGLSVPIRNMLMRNGWSTKAQVLHALNNGELSPVARGCGGYGKKGHIELCRWAGHPCVCPTCNQKIV